MRGEPMPYMPGHGKVSARGKRGRHWKGGRISDKNNYVLVYRPEHPFARKNGYIYEHIIVIEAEIGRFVDRDTEQVHHINQIPDDNRPENLELLPIDEHQRHHMRQRWATESFQQSRRAVARTLWSDSAYRAKVMASNKTPAARRKQATSLRARWSDPEFRSKMLAARTRTAAHEEIASTAAP